MKGPWEPNCRNVYGHSGRAWWWQCAHCKVMAGHVISCGLYWLRATCLSAAPPCRVHQQQHALHKRYAMADVMHTEQHLWRLQAVIKILKKHGEPWPQLQRPADCQVAFSLCCLDACCC